MLNKVRVKVKVEAFGYIWEKEWGAPLASNKIVQIDAVILTIGVGIGIFV